MRAWWVVLIALAGCMQPTPGGPDTSVTPPVPDNDLMSHLQQVATFPEMRIETDFGTIRTILYTGWTPQTAGHIGGLAEDGFYDGLLIHRVVDDFVIQGGDPTGTGEGGSGPGGLSTNTVPLEIHEGLDFGSGAVGLARWTDDTGDSQWFITEKPALHLSRPAGPTGEVFGAYSLFGQVFEGLEVVRQIAAVETLPNDRPVEDVHVQNAELLPPPQDADLIGVVPDVVPDFPTWYHTGVLEVPRFIVVGHPATFRFTSDPPEEGECAINEEQGEPFITGAANVTPAPWTLVADDACTFELEVVFDVAGPYSIASTDVVRDGENHHWDFDVLPWHDDYRPFTGNVTNPT